MLVLRNRFWIFQVLNVDTTSKIHWYYSSAVFICVKTIKVGNTFGYNSPRFYYRDHRSRNVKCLQIELIPFCISTNPIAVNLCNIRHRIMWTALSILRYSSSEFDVLAIASRSTAPQVYAMHLPVSPTYHKMRFEPTPRETKSHLFHSFETKKRQLYNHDRH